MKQFPKTSPAEVIELAKSFNPERRLKAVDSPNIGDDVLEVLVKDPDPKVREAVAKLGYGLDTLVHDENWYIRELVAEHGYGLELLVNDEDDHVRAAVARQGYGLEELLYDTSSWVRLAVAEQGYGLDKLIHDVSTRVRAEVKKRLGPNLSSYIQTQGDYTLEVFQRDTPTYEKVYKKHLFTDKWFINNFPYGAPSAKEVLAKLEEENQAAPYTLSSLQHDVPTLMKVMEKHLTDYAEWFSTEFPNGATSAEEVLSKL